MPDVPPALDEVAALRVANAGLRRVIEAKDTEIRVLPEPVEALSAHVAELRARSRLADLIEAAVGRKAGQARAQVAAPQVRAQARPAEGPAGCRLDMVDHLAAVPEKILRASWICRRRMCTRR